MRTFLSWISALLLTLQAVPVLADESVFMPVIPGEPAITEQSTEEIDDAICRKELKIAEGRITIGYLLTKYRRCLNRERQAREVQRTVDRQQQTIDATATGAKSRLEILRRGSRRVLQNQTALRMLQARTSNLKSGKITFQRVRRRDSYPATGSGGVK